MTNRVRPGGASDAEKSRHRKRALEFCQDRKVEFVYAFEYEHALAQLTGALTKIDTLQAIGYQLAWTKPRIGEWEHSYRALQQRACKILASISATSPRLANANQEQS